MNEFQVVPSEEMNQVAGGSVPVLLIDAVNGFATGIVKLVTLGVEAITPKSPSINTSSIGHYPKVY